MNSLFGVELPTAVSFIIAFIFVLLLIGAAAWLVRRFGTTQIDANARGRQPRLAVIDSASVDGRRKLVIIRRDNIEHLLMIGGPTDVVVETNIVRGTATATRETAGARNPAPETLLRPMPLPDPTPWPLQPEPAPAAVAVPAARADRAAQDDAWPEPEMPAPASQAPPVRAVRPADTLAGLAEELARPGHGDAPRVITGTPAGMAGQSAPPSDQSLAEMAQRLEAALRRPAGQKIVAEGNRVLAVVEVKPATRITNGAQPKSEIQAKPQQSSLEQEMANLLSRPGKT